MRMIQKEWILDPFPSTRSDWVMNLRQFSETLGEKCYALLEGNEEDHQRTYYGFGEGWILSPETWEPGLPPDPLDHLRDFCRKSFPEKTCESGIIGYLDYEWGLLWQKPKATTAKPNYFFRLCPINLVLLPGSQKVILEIFSKDDSELIKLYDHWSKNLDRWISQNHYLSQNHFQETTPSKVTALEISMEQPHNPLTDPIQWHANFKPSEFLSHVEKIKEYIRSGDIFQAVLSQCFTLKRRIDPWSAYQKLRILNPSPWLFCLFGEKETLVGSSPELMLSSVGSQIQTRPIAGTRPRGKDPLEDEQLEQELREDAKEMAEHAMLVDLGRNDLGRVSEYGSICLSQFCSIQRFSHVMHIVSTVEGRLGAAYDSLDALQAVLPAGTLSGAPKVRAMEILQELEPTRRGPYGGALGIYRWNGDLDFCITIRTLTVKDDQVSVQSGAGIVFDSIPEREYEETLHKARVLFKVVEDL
ncbi:MULTISPECIES: anthranilate synthase component I family protein [Desulfitobacterium]|uniref:Anthranilate/para-aminobenzoate synthase component I n=1 Tax=Desulfitobacterium dehalogenans (strain ATCC 51507 / DSM 9161 / JW/IU-DC1) TaxID=756499 RepID=I4ADI7_DESDJ|nr:MULTISPECIES: anthranilate synthase component I family protein [Desulfitobacterium]AFM02022.1 anthranilate/para-aminobenzoate synthase component I [Desulfitobacterium dehalogenans ATCC 51507]